MDKKVEHTIQNAIYRKKHILKIFDLKSGLYGTYVGLDYFKPTIRKSTEPGMPNLYSFDDLMKIAHFFILLRSLDFPAKFSANVVHHKNANDYSFSVSSVFGDKDSLTLIQGNIKFFPKVATESLCSIIIRTIKLDELEQRK